MQTMVGRVTGKVQGVSFRFFVQQQAESAHLNGYARNMADGSVEFLLQGDPAAIEHALVAIAEGPSAARVDSMQYGPSPDKTPVPGFSIL